MCRCVPVLVCRCALDGDNNSLTASASLSVWCSVCGLKSVCAVNCSVMCGV